MVSTLAEDSNQFKKVVSAFPRKKKGEFKYANATMKDAEPVFDRLTETDFTFSERHRSRRNETFKDADKAKEFYVGRYPRLSTRESENSIRRDYRRATNRDGAELKALCRDVEGASR